MRRGPRWPTLLLASAGLVAPALGQTEPTLTVQGTGTANKGGAGSFSATLPDGTVCAGAFYGGKISLFGQSATKTKATCTIGGLPHPTPTVVHRRLNGSPKEAIMTFRDGTKVLVVIPPADEQAATQ
jgi:hypothetical protein